MKRRDVELCRAELIDALKSLAAVEGPGISLARFCRGAGVCDNRIYRCFESWGDLREEAGLPRQINRSSSAGRYSSEELLAALQSAAEEFGPSVTLRKFVRLTGITAMPIYRVFGSWRAFKEAAGLPPARPAAAPPEHAPESMLELVRETLATHGAHLTQIEFCELTGVKRGVVYRCGGWERLRLQLGHFRKGRKCWLLPDDPLKRTLDELVPLEPIDWSSLLNRLNAEDDAVPRLL